MKRKNKVILKTVFLLSLVIIGFIIVKGIFSPTSINHKRWIDFYKIPDETLDIVFIGSSHGDCAFIPMVFNDELSIDSYVSTASAATIEQTYFTLREVLKNQSPKIVILETFTLNEMEKSWTHHSFDGMKPSKNKIEAIKYNDPKSKMQNYIFPTIDYHARWKNIFGKESITFNPYYLKSDENPYFGYSLGKTVEEENKYLEFAPPNEITDKIIILPDERMKMLDNITILCRENDITLIYVSAPYMHQGEFTYVEMYETLRGLEPYAEQNDIEIINFNMLNEETGIKSTDFVNVGHMNMLGAYRISMYLVNHLKANYSEALSDTKTDMNKEQDEKYKAFLEEYAVFEKYVEDNY